MANGTFGRGFCHIKRSAQYQRVYPIAIVGRAFALQALFCHIPQARNNPAIVQKMAMVALMVGDNRTEYSIRTLLQAMEVHARRAFHDARINTAQPVRVTMMGRFI